MAMEARTGLGGWAPHSEHCSNAEMLSEVLARTTSWLFLIPQSCLHQDCNRIALVVASWAYHWVTCEMLSTCGGDGEGAQGVHKFNDICASLRSTAVRSN